MARMHSFIILALGVLSALSCVDQKLGSRSKEIILLGDRAKCEAYVGCDGSQAHVYLVTSSHLFVSEGPTAVSQLTECKKDLEKQLDLSNEELKLCPSPKLVSEPVWQKSSKTSPKEDAQNGVSAEGQQISQDRTVYRVQYWAPNGSQRVGVWGHWKPSKQEALRSAQNFGPPVYLGGALQIQVRYSQEEILKQREEKAHANKWTAEFLSFYYNSEYARNSRVQGRPPYLGTGTTKEAAIQSACSNCPGGSSGYNCRFSFVTDGDTVERTIAEGVDLLLPEHCRIGWVSPRR